MESKRVTVSLGDTDFLTRMTARTHEVIADEPLDLGGGDLGPAPYELLLMAVGSCSVITMKMYAARKGWKVDDIRIELTHDVKMVPGPGGSGSVKEDVIGKSVTIEGDLTDEQIERLVHISSMCPVHRSLEGTIRLETRLM